MAALALSVIVYVALNIMNPTYLENNVMGFSSSISTPLGFVTANFIHTSQEHLIGNLIIAILILQFLFVLDSISPRMFRLNPIIAFVVPVLLAHFTLAIIPPLSGLIIPPAVGFSLINAYTFAFILTFGWKEITTSFVHMWNNYSKSKKLSEHVLFYRYALFLSVVLALVWAMPATFFSCISQMNPGCFANVLSEYAHFVGFGMGIVFGWALKK